MFLMLLSACLNATETTKSDTDVAVTSTPSDSTTAADTAASEETGDTTTSPPTVGHTGGGSLRGIYGGDCIYPQNSYVWSANLRLQFYDDGLVQAVGRMTPYWNEIEIDFPVNAAYAEPTLYISMPYDNDTIVEGVLVLQGDALIGDLTFGFVESANSNGPRDERHERACTLTYQGELTE